MPLFINEFTGGGRGADGNMVAAPDVNTMRASQPGLTITGTSAQSAAFNSATGLIEVHAQEATCLAFGTNPTAVNTAWRIAAGETRYYTVPVGRSWKVAGVLGV